VFRAWLIGERLATAGELDDVDARAAAAVDDAFAYAYASAAPAVSERETDVFAP
jgi:TPP-dependent pyruvate/acetoin dehydrogenase alpha subunit